MMTDGQNHSALRLQLVFASVETLLDPSLADGPTAVCGDPESRHGIILAKNEGQSLRRTNCRDHLAGETKMPGFTAGSTASERNM